MIEDKQIFPGFVGPSYQGRSRRFDNQRCINLYCEIDESAGASKPSPGKNQQSMVLIGTPGLRLVQTVGTGPIRGMYTISNLSETIIVSGNEIYTLSGANAIPIRLNGNLKTQTGFVSIADNGNEVVIVDGKYGYTYTLGSTSFSQITSEHFYPANTVTFQDGYLIFSQTGTTEFFISDLYTSTFLALNQSAKTGNSDILIGVASVNRQLYLLGARTIEIWWNQGASGSSPFARQDGRFSQQGCAAAGTIQVMNESLYWLSSNAQGGGMVMGLVNAMPERLSTHAVELSLQNIGDLSLASAYTYQEEGHYFYCLNVPGTDTTWVYDTSTNLWAERQSKVNGIIGRHLGQNHAYLNQDHLIGDYRNGNVYVYDLNYYSDNGESIPRIRQTPHVSANNNNVFYSLMDVDCQFGVGVQEIEYIPGAVQYWKYIDPYVSDINQIPDSDFAVLLYLKCAGAAHGPIVDSSSYNRHPTISGTAYINGYNELILSANSSLTYPGTDFIFAGDFTAEARVSINNKTQLMSLFKFGTEASNRFEFGQNIDLAGYASSRFSSNFYGSSSNPAYGGLLEENEYYYVKVVRKSNVLSVWINDNIVYTGTETNIVGNGPFVISTGASQSARISLLRVTNRALYDVSPNTSQFDAFWNDDLYLYEFNSIETKDPHWSNVTALLPMTMPGISSIYFGDATGNLWGRNNTPIIATGRSKFGYGAGHFVASNHDSISTGTSGFPIGTQDFTIEAWIYADSMPSLGNRGSLLTNFGAANHRGIDFGILEDASVYFTYSTDGINANTIRTGAGLVGGAWNHVSVVSYNQILTIYVDGVGAASGSLAGSIFDPSATSRFIGGFDGDNQSYYNGWINDFRITLNVARYTSDFAVPTSAFPIGSAGPADFSKLQNGIQSTSSLSISSDSHFGDNSVSVNGLMFWNQIYTNIQTLNEFTIDFWVKLITPDISFGFDNATHYTGSVWFQNNSGSGHFEMLKYNSPSNDVYTMAPYSSIPTNTWTRISVQRRMTSSSTAQTELFINGINVNNTSNGYTGALYCPNHPGFFINMNGLIDELRVVTYAALGDGTVTNADQAVPFGLTTGLPYQLVTSTDSNNQGHTYRQDLYLPGLNILSTRPYAQSTSLFFDYGPVIDIPKAPVAKNQTIQFSVYLPSTEGNTYAADTLFNVNGGESGSIASLRVYPYYDSDNDLYNVGFSSGSGQVTFVTVSPDKWNDFAIEINAENHTDLDSFRIFVNGVIVFSDVSAAWSFPSTPWVWGATYKREQTDPGYSLPYYVAEYAITPSILYDTNYKPSASKGLNILQQGIPNQSGVDPRVTLEISHDGGETFGNPIFSTLGKIGAYTTRCRFDRLGYARDAIFKITITDAVNVQILSCMLDIEEGDL